MHACFASGARPVVWMSGFLERPATHFEEGWCPRVPSSAQPWCRQHVGCVCMYVCVCVCTYMPHTYVERAAVQRSPGCRVVLGLGSVWAVTVDVYVCMRFVRTRVGDARGWRDALVVLGRGCGCWGCDSHVGSHPGGVFYVTLITLGSSESQSRPFLITNPYMHTFICIYLNPYTCPITKSHLPSNHAPFMHASPPTRLLRTPTDRPTGRADRDLA